MGYAISKRTYGNFGKIGSSKTSTAEVNLSMYAKIISVQAIDNHTLVVEFDNQQRRKYDVIPLLEKEMFADLKNSAFLKNVRVDQGGYAVYWNDKVDISEYELWTHGIPIP